MEINLDKKAQVRLITILATIVLLSTIVLATVALNESNQTNEIEKNISDLNISVINSTEPVIEINPSVDQQINEAEIAQQTITGGNLNDVYAAMPEAWWATCADGVSIVWDSTKQITMPSNNGQNIEITGAYKPSIHTYEAFPECVNLDDLNNYVNMTCLLERCSEIIEYNVINGERRTIWRHGDIW